MYYNGLQLLVPPYVDSYVLPRHYFNFFTVALSSKGCLVGLPFYCNGTTGVECKINMS